MDASDQLYAALASGEWEFPGRLSSHLADAPGPLYRDPFGWREIIDAEMLAGRIVRQDDGRLAAVSAEDVEARAEALAHVDNRTPMALEPRADPVVPLFEFPAGNVENAPVPPGPDVPPKPENPLNPYAPPPEPVPQPVPQVAKRIRRTPEQIAADKAEKAATVALAKAARAAERDALKIARAQERVEARQAASRAKLEEAEGGTVQLPAVVFRDGTVRHVSDMDAWAVIELCLDHLFLDCETSGYPLGHQLYELRTIQLGNEHAAVVFDAQVPEQMQIASLALGLARKISAHSAAADAIPCVVAGLISWDDIWAKMHDSVLYLKLTDPKLSGSDASKLKEAAGDLLFEYAVSPNAEKAKNALFKVMGCLVETDVTTPPERSGWYMVRKNCVTMVIYAGSDVLDLAAVMRVLPPLPVADSVLERERWFEAKCARVGLDGFKLDSPHIKEMIKKHEHARNQAQVDVSILSENRISNPSSPEVAKALIAQFPEIGLGVSKKTGDPSAAKKELEKVARTDNQLLHHLCKQILEYRHNVTTLGLLLRPLETLCDYGDGRMRPTVYTINADTGRTSCVRPNGQQFSRQGGIRASVRADPGYLGISADFQGCEIKVAAGLSGDADLLAAEISPKCYACDGNPCECGKAHTGLHWFAAHTAFGPGALYEHRYMCKRGIFCRLFGGGPETAADQVYCDVADMKRVWSAFDEIAPVYVAWDKWLRQCYYEGMTVWRDYETGQNFSQQLDGKRRGVYRTYSGRNIYVNAPHAFGNYAIQGTARELLVDGVIRWSQTPWGSLPLLPIHDEILVWVPEADALAARSHLVASMATSVLSSPGFDVLIGADADEPFLAWQDSS